MNKQKLIIIVIVFLLGLYFVTRKDIFEGFDKNRKHHRNKNKDNYRCPDVLIQKGKALFLFNSKLAKVPGVNPVRFNNLEEYVEFTDWQRGQGIRCPIMYLQESYDAQGNQVFKARPSPTDMQGGLPDMQLYLTKDKLTDAGQDSNPPYNINSFPAFDPSNQNIGLDTPLDKMFNENKGGVSPNPMDPNWGGNKLTQSLVDAGYYKGDEVIKQYTSMQDNTLGNAQSNTLVNAQSNTLGNAQSNTTSFPAFNPNVSTGLSPNPMDDNWGGGDYTKRLVDAGYYKGDEVIKQNVSGR